MGVATWLLAAAILHDLIVLPLYAGSTAARGRALPGAAINYMRIPAAMSLLMLVVFWGTIAGKGAGAYHAVSGRSFDGYGRAGCSSAPRCSRLLACCISARRGSAARHPRGR